MAKILMPKATAVWLLENTSLTFSQISNFCELHILEIESIANGEVVNKMPGINPINNKFLTIDEIKKCEKNSKLKFIEGNPFNFSTKKETCVYLDKCSKKIDSCNNNKIEYIEKNNHKYLCIHE